jgi:hypothetical protein
MTGAFFLWETTVHLWFFAYFYVKSVAYQYRINVKACGSEDICLFL